MPIWARRVENIINETTIDPIPLERFLLPDDHPDVLQANAPCAPQRDAVAKRASAASKKSAKAKSKARGKDAKEEKEEKATKLGEIKGPEY